MEKRYKLTEDRFIKIDEEGNGWWETLISAGHCGYDRAKRELWLGDSKVYTEDHHGLPIPQERIRHFNETMNSLPDFDKPIENVIFIGTPMTWAEFKGEKKVKTFSVPRLL